MNRNQKIALGCGGAGCLGLILLVVLGVVLVVTGVVKAPGVYDANRNSNYNSNNSNYNYNSNNNSNSNSNSNDNVNSSSDSPTDVSSMSDDDKHKLFQAAAATQDHDLTRKVWEKLGLLDANGSPSDDYGPFVRAHIGWVFKNASFVQSINTPEKARAYVDEHMPE